MFSRLMYSQMLSSVQSSSGWIRRWVPGANSVLNWFQNSGGWSPTSHCDCAVPGREVALLRAAALLVGAGAHDDAGERLGVPVHLVRPLGVVEPVAGPLAAQRVLERVGLERLAARDPVDGAVGEGPLLLERLAVLAVDHGQIPLQRQPVPILDHLGNLERGVDVDQRDRHVAEERLAGEPEQDRAVLADRPQHPEVLEVGVRLPQDVHAPVFQLVEMIHDRLPSAIASQPRRAPDRRIRPRSGRGCRASARDARAARTGRRCP